MSGSTDAFTLIKTGYEERGDDFADDVRAGLMATSKHLSCRRPTV